MEMMIGGSMKKRYLTIILLVLSAALVLSACEAVDDYNRSRNDRNVLIPGTGDNQNDAIDRSVDDGDDDINTDDTLFIDRDANNNDNNNDNNNNNNGRGKGNNKNKDKGNDNVNDNANDNGAIPVTGEGEFDEDFDRDNLTRVSHLVGSTVVSESGEVVGQVQSVLVHPVSGKIHYLVLDAEDDLDLERDYVLLPWSGIHRSLNARMMMSRCWCCAPPAMRCALGQALITTTWMTRMAEIGKNRLAATGRSRDRKACTLTMMAGGAATCA
jgi:sporulation protein YlmC with PRC-barrel domain